MVDVMNTIKNASNGSAPYNPIRSNNIPDITPLAPTTFNYVGSVHNVKELDDVPKDFLKDFNIVVVTEGSEGIGGTKGTYYYLNHKWNKWIDSVSTEPSFTDGINVFYDCLYDMLQFGLDEWREFANVAKAFNVNVSVPDSYIPGTLERLLLDNEPIVIYNAYKFYKETQSKKAKTKRTEALDNIIDIMKEFDISTDDIRDHLSCYVKSQISGEDIQIGKINEEPTYENISLNADCTKCLQRPICLPRKDVQNLVKMNGCRGFTLDKSR
jgi:hypothetical protein